MDNKIYEIVIIDDKVYGVTKESQAKNLEKILCGVKAKDYGYEYFLFNNLVVYNENHELRFK